MKRIFFLMLFSLTSVSFAFANVYIEGFGAYTMAGDIENQTGAGFGLGYGVTDNVNVFARGIFNSVTIHADTPEEESYSYRMFMGVVEYAWHFRETPLVWTNSLGIGASTTRAEFELAGADSAEETGLTLAAWTGMAYVATQHVSPFIQVGYHKSTYGADFKSANVSGFQFLAGVRVTIFGSNRSIDSDY